MRYLALIVIVLLSLGTAVADDARRWDAEIEWGDSIPAGTVYNVKFDSTGSFKAERHSLPITSGGNLTTIVHEATIDGSERAALRDSLERCIRTVNLDKVQGHMVGDGFYVNLYLWDGTVALAVQMKKLSSNAEKGKDVLALIESLTRNLPAGFIK